MLEAEQCRLITVNGCVSPYVIIVTVYWCVWCGGVVVVCVVVCVWCGGMCVVWWCVCGGVGVCVCVCVCVCV